MILVDDYNAQIGRENQHKGIVGKYPTHIRTNKNGEKSNKTVPGAQNGTDE